ncbi:hypothetical protein M501DRAFT_965281, partial [Patellaria atrata CBS 101060]
MLQNNGSLYSFRTGSLALYRRPTRTSSYESGGISGVYDDAILEPRSNNNLELTMSEVLLSVSNSSETTRQNRQGIESVLPHGSSLLNSLPSAVFGGILKYLDIAAYRALRLTSRDLLSIIPLDTLPKRPRKRTYPVEILQNIYNFLTPVDFNACRRTCRLWMLASLNRNLLVTMLKRGGWWSTLQSELLEREARVKEKSSFQESDEWIMSKRISRECALSHGWSGNGLRRIAGSKDEVPFTARTRVDFTNIAYRSNGQECRHNKSLLFFVSICDRFLLVVEGSMIYVYRLEGVNIRSLTRVLCPRRVLAVSMDASSNKYSIAALLEGRMGMVCDLQFPPSANKVLLPSSPAHAGRNHAEDQKLSRGRCQARWRSFEFEAPQNTFPVFNTINVHNNHQTVTLHNTSSEIHQGRNIINQDWTVRLRGTHCQPGNSRTRKPTVTDITRSIPLNVGPRRLYRHLCSEDDPPRSVAICPQRRCVAFGCSSGIELLWVDALTGHDLNRWFPLTAPSDFLYFLPPRSGLDSSKKLRLISSASHPSERKALCRRFYADRPAPCLYWGLYGLESTPSFRAGATVGFDHYRALPLSDGYHVLFTDPASSMLCLGTDAPLGGPTKLLRKIMFIPPDDAKIPRLYSVCMDLRWGVRIAAVYEKRIVLFTVPPDVFALSTYEHR